MRALQQAYQAELDAGESLGAVRIAFWLGLVLLTGGDYAVGGGWVARAQRLLDDEPGDVVERGYLLIHHMHERIGQGDFAAAIEIAPRITEYGRRFRDPTWSPWACPARVGCCCTPAGCPRAWRCSTKR